jgi:hypothetical protein
MRCNVMSMGSIQKLGPVLFQTSQTRPVETVLNVMAANRSSRPLPCLGDYDAMRTIGLIVMPFSLSSAAWLIWSKL